MKFHNSNWQLAIRVEYNTHLDTCVATHECQHCSLDVVISTQVFGRWYFLLLQGSACSEWQHTHFLTASSTVLLQRIITSLHQKFLMTGVGSLNYFLGIFMTCSTSGCFCLSVSMQLRFLSGLIWLL